MPPSSSPEKNPLKAAEIVDDVIKTLESRLNLINAKYARALAHLKSVRGLGDLATLETINKLVDEITQGLEGAERDDTEEDYGHRRTYSGTIIERVRQFFVDTANEPATNATIRDAIKTSRGTLAMVLYKTHSDEFEKFTPSSTHLIHWKLTNEAFRAARAESSSGDYGYSGTGDSLGNDPIPF